MSEAFVVGLVAGYGLAIPLGGVAVLMIEHTSRTRMRNGVAAAFGATAADAMYAVIASVGGVAIASVILPVSSALRILAATVLVAMAVHIVVRSFRPTKVPLQSNSEISMKASFTVYFGLTALNPWPIVYFTAFVLGSSGGALPPGEMMARLAGIVLSSASWQLLLACAGASLGKVLSGSLARRLVGTISGALILFLALTTVLRL